MDFNSLITNLPAIITAIGVIYAAYLANKKLNVIHVAVNSQLTEAVNRFTVSEERNRLLKELLVLKSPDDKGVIALINSMSITDQKLVAKENE